jgi:tetratricopeptide (TPR) repeat protein
VTASLAALGRRERVSPDRTAFRARWAGLRAALLGFLVVAPLAFSNGGYWPPAWGWSAFALFWISVLGLLLSDLMQVERFGLAIFVSLSALFGWTLLSDFWSTATRSPLESQRTLVYVAGISAVLVLVRRPAAGALVAGVWAAITVASAFGLLTKLFPDRYGLDPDYWGYRLAEPLGYWNALGIFAALGTLLGLGLATHAHTRLLRSCAAASLPVLVATLYFTFSRGPWVALAIGLAAVLVIERKRLALITMSLALLPFAALAVWMSAQPDALNRQYPLVTEATREGHRLAAYVAGLACASALTALAVGELRRRIPIPHAIRIAYLAMLIGIAGLSVIVGIAHFGNPARYPGRVYDALATPRDIGERNVDARAQLFSVSSSAQWRVDHWRVAWDEFEKHPWIGSGAGTFERAWHLHRPFPPGKVRDAFSLYLETLAELGIIGLTFLVICLAVPFVAVIRSRRHGLLPAAFGAYVAFLAHAAFDWDWEMPAVTLAALFCGAAIVVWARDDAAPPLSARPRMALALVFAALGGFSFVGLIGNSSLAVSREAREDGDFQEAESEARNAIRWMPWFDEPWLELARVQRDRGDTAGARRSLRRAIAKDAKNWRTWYVLARVSVGAERKRAIARARALNPLSIQITRLQAQLAERSRLRAELAIAEARGDLAEQARLRALLAEHARSTGLP